MVIKKFAHSINATHEPKCFRNCADHFSSPTINLNEPAPKVFSCELPLGAQWKTFHPKAKAEKSFDLVALRTDTLEPTTNRSKSQTKIQQHRKNAPSQKHFC